MKLQSVLMFLLENPQLTTLGAVFIGIKVLDEMYFKPATKPGYQKKKNRKDRTLKCGKIENVSGIFFGESSKKGKYIFPESVLHSFHMFYYDNEILLYILISIPFLSDKRG